MYIINDFTTNSPLANTTISISLCQQKKRVSNQIDISNASEDSDASAGVVASEGPEEVLDFKGKDFNMHFCPKAICGNDDCDYIYFTICYVNIQPVNKRARTTSTKARKSTDVPSASFDVGLNHDSTWFFQRFVDGSCFAGEWIRQ
jgi:hypothetical protein